MRRISNTRDYVVRLYSHLVSYYYGYRLKSYDTNFEVDSLRIVLSPAKG